MKKILLLLALFAASASTAYALSQSALLVAASNQYFTAADSAPLSQTGDVTVETYVKFTSMPADRSDLISKPNSAQNGYDAYVLELEKSGANYNLRGITDVSGALQVVTYASWNPALNTWYHVAYTRNSTTGVQKILVNATEVQSTTNTAGASNDSTSPLYLGRFGSGVALNLDGRLALTRVWNVARTATEINNAKCTVYGTATTNMQAEWSLDNVLTDASGNSGTLTNTNTATFGSDVPTCLQTTAQAITSDLTTFD